MVRRPLVSPNATKAAVIDRSLTSARTITSGSKRSRCTSSATTRSRLPLRDRDDQVAGLRSGIFEVDAVADVERRPVVWDLDRYLVMGLYIWMQMFEAACQGHPGLGPGCGGLHDRGRYGRGASADGDPGAAQPPPSTPSAHRYSPGNFGRRPPAS